jgi:hypothetical protein
MSKPIVVELYTRKQFMHEQYSSDQSVMMQRHRRYYSQFVNERTIAHVVKAIGREPLLSSTDPHLNDIPLRKWDGAGDDMPKNISYASVGDFRSLSGDVCIAKEAARQFIERERSKK